MELGSISLLQYVPLSFADTQCLVYFLLYTSLGGLYTVFSGEEIRSSLEIPNIDHGVLSRLMWIVSLSFTSWSDVLRNTSAHGCAVLQCMQYALVSDAQQ